MQALPTHAEKRDETHPVGDWIVKIAVVDTAEILTVGPSDHDLVQILPGAGVEIVASVGDAEGDARSYWLATLGDAPASDGPVTTCAAMTVALTTDAVVLEADPISAVWAWAPGKGWPGGTE